VCFVSTKHIGKDEPFLLRFRHRRTSPVYQRAKLTVIFLESADVVEVNE
jgi:hypothetical protein